MNPFVLATGEGRPGVSIAVESLKAGQPALDVVEDGIRAVESDSSIKTVGFGGLPNALGAVECDASIMCGTSLRVGAVGALKGYLHAISVARQVMERTPHVMLAGEGAMLFAADIGERQVDLLSPDSQARYEEWLRTAVPEETLKKWPNISLVQLLWGTANPETAHGTTCFLAESKDGNWAGGASTSGWGFKHPGRLGDTCTIGAGLYVDRRYGAAACTHTGEMTIRAGTARAIVAYMKKGASVEEACRDALDDLRSLSGGYKGPVVIHALDSEENPFVISHGLDAATPYWFWRQGMEEIECRAAVMA